MFVRIKSERESVIYRTTIYKHGSELEMDDAVAQNLIERGYAEAVGTLPFEPEEEPEEEAPAGEILKGHLDPDDLRAMKYQDLRKLAADMELDSTGTKEELVCRIAGVEVEVNAEDTAENPDELPMTSMPE